MVCVSVYQAMVAGSVTVVNHLITMDTHNVKVSHVMRLLVVVYPSVSDCAFH